MSFRLLLKDRHVAGADRAQARQKERGERLIGYIRRDRSFGPIQMSGRCVEVIPYRPTRHEIVVQFEPSVPLAHGTRLICHRHDIDIVEVCQIEADSQGASK